jgi:hypothetical protein
MRQDILRIYEGPEFGAAGTDQRYPQTLTELGVNPRVRYSLDGRDILTFSVPDTPQMQELIIARKVVRLTPQGEDTSEWLVSRTSQAAGPEGNGMMVVECEPVRMVLSDAGILEYIETGGQPFANLGGVNGSARNFLATFVVPHLTRRGYTWIEIGQIDSTTQFSLSWDAFTSTQLIEAVAREVGAEWQLRRDEPNSRYVIDIVERISGVISEVEAREGLNILQLVRQRNREKLFTSIRPSGLLPEGSQERATLGYATWRVTNVTGDVIAIEPHQGGIGAVLEDGQHVGLFVESGSGTYHEIEGSVESTQTLELESGAGASFSVGDDVMIVADNQGTLLSSVESPSGIAQFGFVQGNSQSKHFGHRNFLARPFVRYDAQPVIVRGTNASTGTSNTRDFSNLPVGHVIAAGDLFKNDGSFAGVTVLTGGTVNGSGNVTITFTGSVSTSSGADAQFYRASSLTVGDWGSSIVSASSLNPFNAASALDEACNADGAITSSTRLALKNVTPGTVITPGTFIGSDTFAMRYVIDGPHTVGSGGTAVVVLNRTFTIGDNAALTLQRPTYPGIGAQPGDSVTISSLAVTFTRDEYVNNRFDETVWFTRDFTYVTGGTNGISGVIRIRDTSNNELVANGPEAVDLSDLANYNERLTHQLTVSDNLPTGTYRFQIVTPTVSSGTPLFAFRAERAQVSLGRQPYPFVEGSEATRIFQDGQIALLASRQWPATYTARLSEIVSEWGLDPYSPALALGSFLRVRSPSINLDTILRVVAIEYDPSDPQDKVFTLDADPERISTLAARARPRPVFVDVNIEVVDNRVRETILVDESPPVVAPGAERFVVPTGTQAPVTNIPLAVTPIPDDTGLIL